ncbi:imm11 family protein [Chitinimonas koreensis]|uniref:imm11 family protein n=1 Tax=Chitinimonas koreensis TaxID=356302 RepID=UPI0012FAE403|nr:DUF1629 domain-containing protein [Chitinimonas koreensis]QNM95560.1 hypothetical protein H9L41_17065 [Chitinimonas koreensis]
MNFYRILADPAATTRWYLKSPTDLHGIEVDPRIFTQGLCVNSLQPLNLPLRRPGYEVDFNFCDFDMVVTPAVINVELERLVGEVIQRIPVQINGSSNKYEILNICNLVQCIDESKSMYTKWTDSDGRPEKIGEYRMIAKISIDPLAANGHHIFRLSGWPIALIISEEVKSLLETRKVSGIKYEHVS